MILEGIVTTANEDGSTNVAPMGPEVDDVEPGRLILKPYKSSRTYGNLRRQGEGVFHVTDDVLLLARATVGMMDAATTSACVVSVPRLRDCCRYMEFRVTDWDEADERTRITCSAVHEGRVRDFFGFNRAKHAVVEAAILTSRVGILHDDAILQELERLRGPVAKTGGRREHEAMSLLVDEVHRRMGRS
jgi:hypothetical protein